MKSDRPTYQLPHSQLIEQFIKKYARYTHKSLQGTTITPTQLKSRIRELYIRKNALVSYEEHNGTIRKLYQATLTKNDLGEDAIFFSLFKVDNNYYSTSQIKKQLLSMRDEINPKAELTVILPHFQQQYLPLLKKIGFEHDATMLRGNIKKSLEIIQKKKPADSNQYRIRKYNHSRDWKILLKAKINEAIKGSQDCRMSYTEKKVQKKMEGFMERIAKNKNFGEAFILEKNKEIIGDVVIMNFPHKAHKKSIHIGNIFIAHKYQGKGLSYLLYKKALEVALKKKKIMWTGATTTKVVFEIATKLKRKPFQYLYTLKPCLNN